jgi:hypothetical protein
MSILDNPQGLFKESNSKCQSPRTFKKKESLHEKIIQMSILDNPQGLVKKKKRAALQRKYNSNVNIR